MSSTTMNCAAHASSRTIPLLVYAIVDSFDDVAVRRRGPAGR
jgi:hypothetical protein